jgi:broad specificity phosphatase PhoE
MKTLYIVRHAESEGNAGNLQQGPVTPLSQKGREQLSIIAERFRTIPVDIIISSPQTRACDTAQAISKITGHDVEHSDLLIERKRPSVMIGMAKDSEEFIGIEKTIKNNLHNEEWRHSDEETFSDLKTRAIGLLAHIESLEEENILMISHGFFMRMVLTCVLFGNKTSIEHFEAFCYPGSEHENTGISVFRQSEYEGELYWTLVTWNDHAHLG